MNRGHSFRRKGPGGRWVLHAALVGCVMFFCGLKPYEAIAGYVALDPHPKAELCSVDRVVKNILIFRPSPNQQSRVIIANQVDVADGDKRWVHALARSYKTVEDLRIRFIVEIERFKRPLSQFQNVMADFGDESPRSGASEIFPRDFNLPLHVVSAGNIEARQIDRIQKYIGPQLPFGGILRPINQSFGNENEPNSYKNQKSFTKLEPDERYFWSLAASILCLGIGWAAWRRIGLVGPLLILYAVAGFVGRFDLFSILLMLR